MPPPTLNSEEPILLVRIGGADAARARELLVARRSGAWLTSPAGGVPHLGGLPAQHVARAHGDRRNGAIHRLEERSRRRTPGARAVMDLFHVTHPAGDALDECRRHIGQERHQRRGRRYRPHGDRLTGKNAQTAIQRYPGLLRPAPTPQAIPPKPSTATSNTDAAPHSNLRNLTNYTTRALLETGGFRPQLHPQL